MPNIQQVLKAEIQRIARKEIKAAIADLKKTNTFLRRVAADHKRRIAQLEKDNRRLLRQATKTEEKVTAIPDTEVEKARITAKMVKSIRERLGISQAAFGKLVGVNRLTVYQWEKKKGRLQFRSEAKAKIIEARKMTKAEAERRLESQ